MAEQSKKQSAFLVLEDGAVFAGFLAADASLRAFGEVCFNTSMTGYQEIITDPSYAGQLVCFTTPHIGNVGVSPFDMESSRAWAAGIIVRDLNDVPCNYRATESLPAFLARQGMPCLFGVDTRALTKHIRDRGAKRGIIRAGAAADAAVLQSALRELNAAVRYDSVDWVAAVTTNTPYNFAEPLAWGTPDAPSEHLGGPHAVSALKLKVTVLDCGVKLNILRSLVSVGCEVRVVPASATASAILDGAPDGVVLSNGPGDPEKAPYVIETVRGLLGKLPILGICLGHQMLALAMGIPTYKLKFGHRGGNHPVKSLANGHVQMTAQNHGYTVDLEAAGKHADLVVTHINLNDQTCEGFASKKRRFLSVQYHPEAAPGPLDPHSIFSDFVTLMQRKGDNAETN
jgi:carbamoyl-phosphate synthase small subunit